MSSNVPTLTAPGHVPFMDVLADAPQAAAALDPRGRYVAQNEAHRRLLGYEAAELVGRTTALPFGDDAAARIRFALAGARSYEGEHVARRRDGREICLGLTVSAMRSADGRLLGHLTMARDLAAGAAATSQRAHVEKVAALGSLAGWLAYEVRTPLTCVTNSLHLLDARLERETPVGPTSSLVADVRALAAAAHDGAERIDRLVEELRRFTLPPPGPRVRSGLHEVAEAAVRLFRATDRDGTALLLDLQPTPDVDVDALQMRQAVLALLANAAEATRQGVPVEVATLREDDVATLVVRDRGEGVPDAVRAHLFEPFHSTKPDRAGLGLSTVRRIVEAHGGSVACETATGRGTTFTARLPVA